MRKKLLILRFSAMGDVSILATLLAKVTHQYPYLQIFVATKKHFAPMFYTLKNVQVIPVDFNKEYKGVLGVYRLYKQLSSMPFDAVLDMHLVHRTRLLRFFYNLFSFQIPFFCINKGRKEKKQLVRAKNKVFMPLKTSYRRYGDLFEKAGFSIDYSENQWVVAPKISLKVQHFINSLLKFDIVGIAPFASHRSKVYPINRTENLISILSKANVNILLFGGGACEEVILDNIARKYSNVYSVAENFSFEEQLQIISQLSVMVAMDSGNAHLSAMYAVPTITIWGVTHPYAGFYPYAQPEQNAFLPSREQFPLIPTSVYGNKYIKGYEKAIETIQEKRVADRVFEILKQKENSNIVI